MSKTCGEMPLTANDVVDAQLFTVKNHCAVAV